MGKEPTQLTIGSAGATAGDIIKVLSTFDANKSFKLVLKPTDKLSTWDNAYACNMLEKMCRRLFSLLGDAYQCVEKCAQMSGNVIYYDRRTGSNGGAKDLKADIDDLFKTYHKEMLQIDLLRSE